MSMGAASSYVQIKVTACHRAHRRVSTLIHISHLGDKDLVKGGEEKHTRVAHYLIEMLKTLGSSF